MRLGRAKAAPAETPRRSASVDLSHEMGELVAAFGPPTPGRGRVIQFVAAADGEGTSTVAREFARLTASRTSRGVWLVDLDLMDDAQARAVEADTERFGPVSGPAAASPDGSMFFAVQPPARGPDGRAWPDARYLSAHAAMGRRLWVTRFRTEALTPGQSVRVLRSSPWWDSLRRHSDWVIVDAPSTARSSAALALAPLVDATVLVVGAEKSDAAVHAGLRDAIVSVGGTCAGVVLNRVRARPPGFLRALGA